MNSRNMILSGALLAVLVAMLTFSSAPIALAVPVTTGPPIVGGLGVFVVKKATLLCDNGASAPGNQNPPEIGGCVDLEAQDTSLLGTVTDARFNDYMFTGEQLVELVVARDLSGAALLPSTANLQVDGMNKVLCTVYTGSTTDWYGHDLTDLLKVIPPVMGTSDKPGFDATYDQLYQCTLTVTPTMVGTPSSVAVKVTDTAATTAISEVQKWYFNPAISISLSFSSLTGGITFPSANPGQTVLSTNSLIINNNAAGGVDLAVYLAGHDLVDTSGIGLCPTSNTLNINDIGYRCKIGSYYSELYTPLPHIKESNTCHDLSLRQCDAEDNWGTTEGTITSKVPYQTPVSNGYNDLLPDATSEFTSLLYNGHNAECWFQLTVPVPCSGTFSASNAIDVLVRAI